ncbi:hypothetical protein, partial [Planotetraspora thailandica]
PAQADTTADTDAPSQAIDELFQDPPVLLPGLLSEGSADGSGIENSFNNSFNCATIFNNIGISCNKIERPDPSKIENKIFNTNTNDNANDSAAEAKAKCNQDDEGKGLCRPEADAATVDAEADDAAESATDTVPAATADAAPAE